MCKNNDRQHYQSSFKCVDDPNRDTDISKKCKNEHQAVSSAMIIIRKDAEIRTRWVNVKGKKRQH